MSEQISNGNDINTTEVQNKEFNLDQNELTGEIQNTSDEPNLTELDTSADIVDNGEVAEQILTNDPAGEQEISKDVDAESDLPTKESRPSVDENQNYEKSKSSKMVTNAAPETQEVEEQEVGSVNDRLSAYQSKVTDTSKPADKAPAGKVGSVDKFKNNYLKKVESPTSSSPGGESTVTPPGTLSLRERMKMFERQDKDRVLARETVSQVERASDIRSKISLWGQSTSNTSYSQKEKIHVGSIDDRKNQYTSLAKI